MEKKRVPDLLRDDPKRVIIRFALPMILGNLLQQFYNMADTMIVGKFVGEDALAAVGASYSFTTVFIMIAIGGGIGSSVIISQYLGAGQIRQMKTSVHTALIAFAAVSLLLMGFGLVANASILRALNTPENIFDDAILYLNVYFWGLPFLFLYNILSSIFNSMGDSKTPLYLLIFSSVLNVALDLLFVAGFHTGVAGAAVATVIAQGIAAVISFLILLKRLRQLEAEEKPGLFDGLMLGKMTKVAIPSILQQSIVSIGMLLVQSVINGFGSSVLAGYSAGLRVESICIVPMIALGNALSTFTAQNMGAREPERVKKGYHACYVIIIALAILMCGVLLVFREPIISAFLSEGSSRVAYDTGIAFVSFEAFFYVLIGFKGITDGVLRGSGDVAVFTAANLCNLAVRVAAAFLLAPVWGPQAVWYAVPMGWATNYVISFIRYLMGNWSKKQLI